MKTIEIFAQVSDQAGAPCAGLGVALESYSLSKAQWLGLGSGSTNAQGHLQLKLALPTAGAAHAPLVRLVLAGEPAGRVLATGGRVSYAPRTGLLSVDAGPITLLAEHATAPASTQRRFKGVGLSLAGVSAPALSVAKPAGVVGLPVKPMPVLDPLIATPIATPVAAVPVAAPVATPLIDAVSLQNLQTDVMQLKSQNTQLQLTQTELQATNTAQQQQVIQLTQQTQSLQTTVDLVTQRNKDVEAQLGVTVDTLSALQDQYLATTQSLQLAQAETLSLREQVSTLSAENKTLKDAALAMPIGGAATTPRVANLQALTSDLHTQFNSASLNLSQIGGGMQLGDVRIRVRGKIAADGSFQMPGVDDLARPGVSEGLDEVEVSLGGGQTAATTNAQVSVPDLSRLTESAARQVLQSLGLRLDSATGLCEDGYVPGQAMRQMPRATLQAPRGSLVMVVFAQ